MLPPRRPRDAGNPAPDVIRRWHIPCPYDHEWCALCGEVLARGELINIEYEGGVMHAGCSGLVPPDPAATRGAAGTGGKGRHLDDRR